MIKERLAQAFFVQSPEARRRLLILTALLLALSLPSIALIPWANFQRFPTYPYPFGIDFHNMHAFHNCEVRNQPYGVSGSVCNDINDQVYPPVLYWSYFWVRGLDYYPTALFLWVGFIVAAMTTVSFAWFRRASFLDDAKKDAKLYFLFWPLFLFQYPLFYAMERANNDVVIAIIWSLAAFAFLRKRIFWAGFFAGLAVVTKIYPAIALGIVSLPLLFQMWNERKGGLWRHSNARFFLGAGVAAVVCLAVTPEQSWLYFTQILPQWSVKRQGRDISVHGVHSVVTNLKWVGPMLAILILGVWSRFSLRWLRRDPLLVFAGALAISTFIPGISNDYSLVTAYPLFMILFARALTAEDGRAYWLTFLGGLVTVLGYRFLWQTPLWNFVGTHIALQIGWICWLPFAVERVKGIEWCSPLRQYDSER